MTSIYHSVLRISALTLSLVLLFVSGVVSPLTAKIASDTEVYVASVFSASAGVTPTDLNLVTASLTKQQADLDSREKSLKERELSIGIDSSSGAADFSSWIVSALLFIILVLITLNYILDFMRANPPIRTTRLLEQNRA